MEEDKIDNSIKNFKWIIVENIELNHISKEELLEVVKNYETKKSFGKDIFNKEILLFLSETKFFNFILGLFNMSLMFQKTSKRWNKSCIFPIQKIQIANI